MVDVLQAGAPEMSPVFGNLSDLPASTLQGGFQRFDAYTLDDIVFSLRTMFYAWTPGETMFKTVDQVPNTFMFMVRYMPLLYLIDYLGMYAMGIKLPRLNSSLMGACTTFMIFLPGTIIGNVEFTWFSLLYEKYRFIDIPYNSVVAWFACSLFADFAAYWWHRAAHEVNFVWAFHSVHHTVDEYNIMAAYRLPTFNRQIAILFYLPIALIFPPGIFYVHYQLNYMWQVWLHTMVVDGPDWLGYLFITPKLHRVHHARNRYCIDKNYGSMFAIWDHLFGTFAPYKEDVELSYGLVSRLQTFDPLAVQTYYLRDIFQRAYSYDSWWDKASAFLKGPGWSPGKPRLGVYEEIAETYDDEPYDKQSTNWCYAYMLWMLGIALLTYNTLGHIKEMNGTSGAVIPIFYIFWIIANVGYFLEHKPWVPVSEVARCVVYFLVESYFLPVLGAGSLAIRFLRASAMFSIFLWSFNLNMFTTEGKKTV